MIGNIIANSISILKMVGKSIDKTNIIIKPKIRTSDKIIDLIFLFKKGLLLKLNISSASIDKVSIPPERILKEN